MGNRCGISGSQIRAGFRDSLDSGAIAFPAVAASHSDAIAVLLCRKIRFRPLDAAACACLQPAVNIAPAVAAVDPLVLGPGHGPQVFRPVVALVLVDVMDVPAGGRGAARQQIDDGVSFVQAPGARVLDGQVAVAVCPGFHVWEVWPEASRRLRN